MTKWETLGDAAEDLTHVIHVNTHLLLRIAGLEKAEKKLWALEAAGVDNWEGYEIAMQILNGDLDPEDL